MNEIIGLIILWIIITLINQFSKKIKREQSRAEELPELPIPGEADQKIPKSFQDIFKKLEESTPDLSQTEELQEEFEDRSGELEEETFEETETELEEVSQEVQRKVEARESQIEKTDQLINKISQKKSDLRGNRYLVSNQSLKQAIVWKEILDKPLSLRRYRNMGKKA